MSGIAIDVLWAYERYARYTVLIAASVTLLVLLAASIRLGPAPYWILPVAVCVLLVSYLYEKRLGRRITSTKQTIYLLGISGGTFAVLFVFATTPGGLFFKQLSTADVSYVSVSTSAALTHELGKHLNKGNTAVALFDDATRAMDLRNYEKAAALYQSSSSAAPTAAAKMNAGVALLNIGGFKPAQEQLISGLDLARKKRDPLLEAGILRALGELYDRQGRFSAARDSLQRAREIDERIRNYQGQGDASGSLALVLSKIGESIKAKEIATEALDLHLKHGSLSSLINDHLTLAMLSQALLERTKAESEARTGLSLASKNHDLPAEGRSLITLAMIQYANGRHPVAPIIEVDQSLDIFYRTGDKNGQMRAWHIKGWIYSDVGKIPLALGFLMNALTLAEETKDVFAQAAILDSIGQAELNVHLDAARQSFTKSLALSEEMGAETIIASALIGLSRVDLAENQLDHAIAEAERALSIGERIQSVLVKAEAWATLGDIELEKNTLASAKESYSNALDYYMRAGDSGEVQKLNKRLQELAERLKEQKPSR